MFSPQGFPNGKVMYDFVRSWNDQEVKVLQDVEPWRQTLCVSGSLLKSPSLLTVTGLCTYYL